MSGLRWTWPVTLQVSLPDQSRLRLRPLERSDRQDWEHLRAENRAWLSPWESTVPGERFAPMPFPQLRRSYDRAARDGWTLPFVLEHEGELVGQMQLFDVLGGARLTGSAGYWLGERATGRGLATWALAALIDHALLDVGLHRVEVAIRPENVRSVAVVQRLSLPEEGLQRGLMFVDGQWRDHRLFAVLTEDLDRGGYAPGGLVRLLRRRFSPVPRETLGDTPSA